ncbi:hypothetical protein Tco_1168355 [Tanacetum coccineum]
MFDEFFNPPPSVVSPVLAAAARIPADLTSLPVSTSLEQDAPSASTSLTQEQEHSLIISQVPFSLQLNRRILKRQCSNPPGLKLCKKKCMNPRDYKSGN